MIILTEQTAANLLSFLNNQDFTKFKRLGEDELGIDYERSNQLITYLNNYDIRIPYVIISHKVYSQKEGEIYLLKDKVEAMRYLQNLITSADETNTLKLEEGTNHELFLIRADNDICEVSALPLNIEMGKFL